VVTTTPFTSKKITTTIIIITAITMVKSTLAFGFAALAAVADATTVAVLEFGKGGVVHRSETSSSIATPHGVMSFWRSLHEAGNDGEPRKERATQYPGMSVVPDLFSRADGGVVVGLVGSSIDLESMPTVAGIIEDGGAVGHIHIDGNQGNLLMKKLSSKPLDASAFEKSLESKANVSMSTKGNKLEAVSVQINEAKDAAEVDASLSKLLKNISQHAESNGSTIVIHLVVDSEDNDSRRRLDGQNYYKDYSDIYSESNFKSMFQIQYYNIVLWTALGLVGILLSVNLMTMYMPLMPDTLLFGESAKMVAE